MRFFKVHSIGNMCGDPASQLRVLSVASSRRAQLEIQIIDGGHIALLNRSTHRPRNDLLRAQPVEMRDRKALPLPATLQKRSKLLLIGRAVAIDELRKRLIVAAHFKFSNRDGLLCVSPSVCLDSHFKEFLSA
jgi:hypothetical protein